MAKLKPKKIESIRTKVKVSLGERIGLPDYSAINTGTEIEVIVKKPGLEGIRESFEIIRKEAKRELAKQEEELLERFEKRRKYDS